MHEIESLEEFVHKTLEATHLIIFQSLAQTTYGAQYALDSYTKFDIENQYQNYLKQIRDGFDTHSAQSLLIKSLDTISSEDQSDPAIDFNLKQITAGKTSTPLEIYDFGKRILLLSELAALYYSMAVDASEKKNYDDVTQCMFRAGVATGKIYGIYEEINRNLFIQDIARNTQQMRIGVEVKKSFKKRQSKGGKAAQSNSPKGEYKDLARERWGIWQKYPNRYKSVMDFYRSLQKDYPENKFNSQVVRRWTKEWPAEDYVKTQYKLRLSHPHDEYEETTFINAMVSECKPYKTTREQIEKWVVEIRQTTLQK
jgi:hypothetical protein